MRNRRIETTITQRVDGRLRYLILKAWYAIVPKVHRKKILRYIREIDQVSHQTDCYGSTVNGHILFSDAIFQLSDEKIMYAILHEFAHVFLLGKENIARAKRTNQLIEDGREAEFEQFLADVEKQRESDEKEADELVAWWVESCTSGESDEKQ